MQAEVTMLQLWANPSIMSFFFRNQAERQLKDLFNAVEESIDDVLDAIEDYTQDLDGVEEILYNESTEDLIEMFGLTPIESDEEEDEE